MTSQHKPHKTEKKKFSLSIYEIGLHLLFLATLYRIIGTNPDSPIPTIGYVLGVLALTVGALRNIDKKLRVKVPTYVRIGQSFTSIGLFCCLVVTTFSDDTARAKIYAIMPYMFLTLAIAGIDEAEWNSCLRAFRIHASVALVVFLLVLSNFVGHGTHAIGNRSAFIKTSVDIGTGSGFSSPIVLMRYILYPYIVLFVLIPNEKPFGKVLAIALLIGMLAWSLIGQFRSVLTVGIGFAILAAVFSWLRSRTLAGGQRVIVMLIPATLLVAFLVVANSPQTDSPASLVIHKTLDRLSLSGSEEVGTGNARFSDAGEFIDQLEPATLFAGRGAIEWISTKGLPLHVGHLKYLMAGGVFMMVGVFLLVYGTALRTIFFSRNIKLLAPACVVLQQFIVAFTVPSMDGPYPSIALVFLCGGYCWKQVAVSRQLAAAEARRKAIPARGAIASV